MYCTTTATTMTDSSDNCSQEALKDEVPKPQFHLDQQQFRHPDPPRCPKTRLRPIWLPDMAAYTLPTRPSRLSH
ncbi:hypothetical protein BDFG_04455 [Blastomyces dermatitidis ATCC 26199]|nr:hypothetical protein BDFG_04455 [Blastomyces dermatitidis ATCC 26199]